MKKFQIIELLLLFQLLFMGFCLLGMLMNFQAIITNHCKMPVSYDIAYEGEKHFTYQNKSEINSWIFSDIIEIYGGIYSIGDFLMFFGFGGLICSYIPYISIKTGFYKYIKKKLRRR